MNTIKIDKKAQPVLSATLAYLVNGLSTDKSRETIMNLRSDEVNGVRYLVATDGRIMLWVENEEIPVGVYSVETTKASWFLTENEEAVYPRWDQIALRRDEIHEKLKGVELDGFGLGPDSCGALSSLIGRISPDHVSGVYSVAPSLLAKIHKGAKDSTWTVIHLSQFDGAIRLRDGEERFAMVMPIAT